MVLSGVRKFLSSSFSSTSASPGSTTSPEVQTIMVTVLVFAFIIILVLRQNASPKEGEKPTPKVAQDAPTSTVTTALQYTGIDTLLADFKAFSGTLLEGAPLLKTQLAKLEEMMRSLQEHVSNSSEENQKDLSAKLKQLEDKFQQLEGKVQHVGDQVQQVDGKFQKVEDQVQQVGDKVQQVGDKVQQVVQQVGDHVQQVGDHLQQLAINVQQVEVAMQHVESKTQLADDNMQRALGERQHVEGKMQDVEGKMQDVEGKMQGVEGKMQQVEDKMQLQSVQFETIVAELQANTQALKEHQTTIQSFQVAPSQTAERRYPPSEMASEFSPGYHTDEHHTYYSPSDVDVIPIHVPPPKHRKHQKKERAPIDTSPKTVAFAHSTVDSAMDSDDTAIEYHRTSDIAGASDSPAPGVVVTESYEPPSTADSEVFEYKPFSELEPSPVQADYDDHVQDLPLSTGGYRELGARIIDVSNDGNQHVHFEDEDLEHRSATPQFEVAQKEVVSPDPVALHSPVENNLPPWGSKEVENDYPPHYTTTPQHDAPRVAEIPFSIPTAGPESYVHQPNMTYNNLRAHEDAYGRLRSDVIDLRDGSDSGMDSSDVASPGFAGEEKYPGLTKNQKKALKRKRREKAKKLAGLAGTTQSGNEYSSGPE